MMIYTFGIILCKQLLSSLVDEIKLEDLLFISNTPYWFMQTYLCLYLFSPMVNSYLSNVSIAKRIGLLLSIGFISVYMGTMSATDFSLIGGKNLANFIFIYCVGNTLSTYKIYWRSVSAKYILIFYLFLNAVLVSVFIIFYGSFISKAIFRLGYPYCSPLLLVNAILFFILVAKRPFKSCFVNYLSASSLAIYLICSSSFIMEKLIGPVALYIRSLVENDYQFLPCVFVMGILLVAICIVIDKLLSPLWNVFVRLGCFFELQINVIMKKIILLSPEKTNK